MKQKAKTILYVVIVIIIIIIAILLLWYLFNSFIYPMIKGCSDEKSINYIKIELDKSTQQQDYYLINFYSQKLKHIVSYGNQAYLLKNVLDYELSQNNMNQQQHDCGMKQLKSLRIVNL